MSAPGVAATDASVAPQGKAAFWLRWLSAVVLLGAVAVRCLSNQVAQPVFDIDPLMAAGAQPGLAPGGSLLLDALVILAASAGLLGELRAGRRVSLALVILAWLPMVAIAWHGAARMEHAWRGATWLGAMLTAVTLAHLGREREIRRMSIAMLLAIVVALAVRGIVQLAIEHPDTVRAYDATKQQFLAERGWAADSPAARMYEERLRQAEASGWFGLANAYSTLMAAGALLAAGLTLAGWMRREQGSTTAPTQGVSSGATGWCAAIALACGGLLAINGSKGAIGAILVGGAVLVVATATIGRRRELPRWLPLALAGLVVLAVAARGLALPEGFAHERSLLFRWHYLVDAAQVIARRPFLGVGPDGFQEAMIAVRSPRHPEEVASAHNVVADWWSSLGILGLAWIVAAALLLARAVGVACAPTSGELRSSGAAGRVPFAAHIATLAIFGGGAAAIGLEAADLDPLLFFLRLLGLLAAVATAAVIGRVLALVDDDAPVRAGILAALCAIAMHAQIEMTLWLHGGAAWCLALLGAAAPMVGDQAAGQVAGRWGVALDGLADRGAAAARRSPRGVAAAVIVGLGLVGVALVGAKGLAAKRVDRALIDAASPISAVGRARLAAVAVSKGVTDPAGSPEALAAAMRDAAMPEPTIQSIAKRIASTQAAEREIGLRTLEEALREREDAARLGAIAELRATATTRGAASDARPTLALGDMALRAGGTLDPAARVGMLEQARGDVDAALRRGGADLRLLRRRAELDEAVATITAQPEGWRRALAGWQATAERDPCAIPPLQRVARAASHVGDSGAALVALHRILELDSQLVLDPRKQLDDRQREAIRREIAALEATSRGP